MCGGSPYTMGCCVDRPRLGSGSFPMCSIGMVASALGSALGEAVDRRGRRAGAIQRLCKCSGSTLLQALVLTGLKTPAAKRGQSASTAAQLGVTVTPHAIEKRFSPGPVAFLRECR